MVLWVESDKVGDEREAELIRVLMGVCSYSKEELMAEGIDLLAVFRVFKKSWAVIWMFRNSDF